MPYDFKDFNFGEDDFEKLEKNLNKREFSGIYCPRRNDKRFCAVCRDVRQLWDAHNETGLEKSPYSEKARKYGASAAVFMNVVFPDDPSEVKILQCGIKMAQGIINGMKYSGWGNVVHPEQGMTINVVKSTDSGFNTYTPSPDINRGKRALSDMSVLEKLNPLDEVHKIIDSADIFNINTIETNKSISFDILPGWDANRRTEFFRIVYYHYNVTSEAIQDGIPKTAPSPVEEEEKSILDTPTVETTTNEVAKDVEETATKKYTLEDPPGCFGKFYQEGDEQCMDASCDDIREPCAEKVEEARVAARSSAA